MSTIGKIQQCSAIKGANDESICGIALMFPDANGEWDSMLEDDTKSKVILIYLTDLYAQIDPSELSFYQKDFIEKLKGI